MDNRLAYFDDGYEVGDECMIDIVNDNVHRFYYKGNRVKWYKNYNKVKNTIKKKNKVTNKKLLNWIKLQDKNNKSNIGLFKDINIKKDWEKLELDLVKKENKLMYYYLLLKKYYNERFNKVLLHRINL